ncbi:hypothetical protein BH11BAC3_BH11BAC3_37070 [soil metagenome]
MRHIVLLTIAVLMLTNKNYAQQTKDTTVQQIDSLQIMKELMDLLGTEDKPSSYAFVNLGIGNRLFSMRNNSLNARQNSVNTIIYTPTVGYFHKSGISITAGANFLNDGINFGAKQYSITPAFDFSGNKRWDVGISYTHYFVQDKFSPFSSPFQDDIYGSVKYKKTWIQPGISIGYSAGSYNEALEKDTIINGRIKRRYDSITYKLNAFSVVLSAGHQFIWYNAFGKNDALTFTPTLMANAGSAATSVTHNSNVALINFFIRKGRIPKLQTDKFEMQSLAINLDLTYTIGKFTFEPQLYLDYYLPETNASKFSQVFAFNVGYSF